jgi:hypothetical protein
VSCCRERASTARKLQTFCQYLEGEAAKLPLRVEQTAGGVMFQVAFAGRVFDLFEAIQHYDCRGGTARAVRVLERSAAVYKALAEPLVGKTTTLGRLSTLR